MDCLSCLRRCCCIILIHGFKNACMRTGMRYPWNQQYFFRRGWILIKKKYTSFRKSVYYHLIWTRATKLHQKCTWKRVLFSLSIGFPTGYFLFYCQSFAFCNVLIDSSSTALLIPSQLSIYNESVTIIMLDQVWPINLLRFKSGLF